MAEQIVAAVRCPDYDREAVERAVREAMTCSGVLAGTEWRGKTVLLKPNLLSPRPPGEAVTTHPEIVRAAARIIRAAGAKAIWIGDSCAGEHADATLWTKTGMQSVADDTGAVLKSFRETPASRLIGDRPVPVPGWLEQVDLIVSLPKLKTHTLTGLTCAMKNTYGLIVGGAKSSYHASHPSPRSMSKFLVHVYMALKPHAFIVDSIEALEGEGPANGSPRKVGLILAGRDGVAVDATCARMLKGGAAGIPMLSLAGKLGAGSADPAHIRVLGDGESLLDTIRLKPSLGRFLLAIPESLFKPVTHLLSCRPKIDDALCVKCGVCAEICSQKAIRRLDDGRYRVEGARCIICMCCAESCPRHAILVKSPLDLFRRLKRTAMRLAGIQRQGESPQ